MISSTHTGQPLSRVSLRPISYINTLQIRAIMIINLVVDIIEKGHGIMEKDQGIKIGHDLEAHQGLQMDQQLQTMVEQQELEGLVAKATEADQMTKVPTKPMRQQLENSWPQMI